MDETLKPRQLLTSFLAPIAKSVPVGAGIGAAAGAFGSYRDNQGEIKPKDILESALHGAKAAPFLALPVALNRVNKDLKTIIDRSGFIQEGLEKFKTYQGMKELGKLTGKELLEQGYEPHHIMHLVNSGQASNPQLSDLAKFKEKVDEFANLDAPGFIRGTLKDLGISQPLSLTFSKPKDIAKFKELLPEAMQDPVKLQIMKNNIKTLKQPAGLVEKLMNSAKAHKEGLIDLKNLYEGYVTQEQFEKLPDVQNAINTFMSSSHTTDYDSRAALGQNILNALPEGEAKELIKNLIKKSLIDHADLSRVKTGAVVSELQPHQQRVLDKLKASGGVLVAHGVGSGKTLSSIAAADLMGLPTDVIAPAPLIANYNKELAKHLDKPLEDVQINSYEKAIRDNLIRPGSLAILDEAHRARNIGTEIDKKIIKNLGQAKARMLLTGTPVYNNPTDLVQLVNAAAGKEVLPKDKKVFDKLYIGQKMVEPGFFDKMIRGVQPTMVPELKNKEDLVRALKGYVDVHMTQSKDYPSREDHEFSVEMSPEQHRIYKFHEGQLPFFVRNKIKAGLPLDKQESQALNAFEGALRQTSNTPRPYIPNGMDAEQEALHTPKIQLMAKHLKDMHDSDPNYRGVVYSNYLNAGLVPMSNALNKAGIKHHVFTGAVSKAERAQMVNDYNTGKVPVLLISSSGTEGLDLKGTKSVQIMEPHWNDAKIDQVIGRGIRYKSHEHLPEHERKVKIMRYYTETPRGTTNKVLDWINPENADNDKGIERYMQNTAGLKNLLSKQIMQAMQEASDAGPLNKVSELNLDSIQLPEGVTLNKSEQRFEFKGPKGNPIFAPYDEEQILKFKGDPTEFTNNLRREMLLASESAYAKAKRENEKRKALSGQALGNSMAALGGWVGSMVPQQVLKAVNLLPHAYPESNAAKNIAGLFNLAPVSLATSVLGGATTGYGGVLWREAAR